MILWHRNESFINFLFLDITAVHVDTFVPVLNQFDNPSAIEYHYQWIKACRMTYLKSSSESKFLITKKLAQGENIYWHLVPKYLRWAAGIQLRNFGASTIQLTLDTLKFLSVWIHEKVSQQSQIWWKPQMEYAAVAVFSAVTVLWNQDFQTDLLLK